MPTNPFHDLALDDHDGRPVRPAATDGWLLFYWYPKADTPGCVAQAESIRDQWEAFGELGCAVYGASFDRPEANRAFRDKYRIPFPLLSDVDGTAAVELGVAAPGDSYAQRIAFLVDPTGAIVRRYEVADPTRFADHVLDDLEVAQAAGGSGDGGSE